MTSHKFVKLKFFLVFIQEDLNDLDASQTDLLTRQLFTLLHMTDFSVFQSSGNAVDHVSKLALDNPISIERLRLDQPDFIEALPEVQSGLSFVLKNLIRAIDRARTGDLAGALPIWEELEDLSVTIQARCLLEGPGNPKDDIFLPYTEIENLNRIAAQAQSMLGKALKKTGKTFEERKIICNSNIDSSITEKVLFHFLYSLHNLPISAIYQCPECSKWFIHTTKRERIFCSNKCAAKSGVRRKRASIKSDDPDEFNKELREGATRARNSYVRRQKQRNKNAIVKRRPTRHKDDADGS